MNKYHKIPLAAGLLYLLAIIISVAHSWLSGVHLFDFGISFSAYIGLQRWISAMYFVFALIINALMSIYVLKSEILLVKKIIYGVIFTGIFGTAFFPFNTFSDAPTAITINLHNGFAIALMLATTISFILSIVTSKIRKHRITAIISLAFAGLFILCYFAGLPLLFKTFFIWENVFIILLFLELYMEQYERK